MRFLIYRLTKLSLITVIKRYRAVKNSELHIKTIDDYYVAGNAASETSVEGVYAAGDILMHEGKVHLITGAFQDAANAVNKAKQFVQPSAAKTAMVSSHNEVFKSVIQY